MTSTTNHFSIGAVSVSLKSTCRSFAREYLALYAPFRCDRPPTRAIDVEIRPRRDFPWPRGPYTLHSSGAADFPVHRRHEVLPHLEWFINWQIIHQRHEFVQLHASSLEIAGRTLILPGGPGSGKTTLTAGLLTRGWNYLCDEFALIDPWTRAVHPYPRALCIKEPSFAVIKRLGLRFSRRPYRKPTKGRVAFLKPLDVRLDIVGDPAPIRWIVFPKYVPGAAPLLRPMTRSHAAYELARQCFNIQLDQRRALACLANVARYADAFQLVCGQLEATCDALMERLPARASRKAG